MSIKVSGLNELKRKLDDLGTRARQLGGTNNVPMSELLTPSFLSENSRFGSFDQMVEASGFTVTSSEDFQAIPEDRWDDFVRQNTSFSRWDDLLSAAVARWTKAKLGL